MKKRLLSMVLTVIMLVSLIPTSVFAAKKSVDDYFDGLPIAADPGTGTTANAPEGGDAWQDVLGTD